MPRILYEASYIGSSKGFFNIAIVVVGLILGLIGLIYIIKREKREYRTNTTEESCMHRVDYIFVSIVAGFWGIFTLIMITGAILGYCRVILRYKKGNYREVQGIVEDYSGLKVYTFKVNGVEFEISGDNATWGYSYWQGENVITGDGQQLKIRYIPGLNSIVYIEEIGPPLTRPDDTEEAQQADMTQEEEIEEPAVPIDQGGIRRSTEEETELIRKIFSQDKEEFQKFLMADRGYPYKETIWISAYDLTGDGIDEILVSKYYVDMSAELTYNYVYDQTGRKILEFIGRGDTRIINGWDGDGTFLLYDKNYYFYAPRYNTNIYTEIRCEDGVLTEKVLLVELDRRPPGDYGEEEYYIFTNFTKEEEEKLWEGGLGVNELTETKAYVREDERAKEYKQMFEESETTGFTRIGMFRYSENDGFQEYVEEK